jgi:lysosomal Pro-X carboxypeptidase
MLLAAIGCLVSVAHAVAPTQTCDRLFITQPTDHNDSSIGEFQVKYYVCARDYRVGGPMFFYTGNEAPVELYLNNTGFMYENASEFGALLVFAEHRYYGASQPFPACDPGHMQYLTADQAMKDYARLIEFLRSNYSTQSAITFGGSYGGMLSAYMRMEYPNLVQGSIAASAPVFSLIHLDPRPNAFGFNEAIASAAGPRCASQLKEAYKAVYDLSRYDLGTLGKKFTTCTDLSTTNISKFIDYLSEPWGDLAMGDYPFASNYITGGESGADAPFLPAYPLQVACNQMDAYSDQLEGLREAIGVYYNASGTLSCFFEQTDAVQTESTSCGSWEYQYCAEFMMPFSSGSESDFFYPLRPFREDNAVKSCQVKYPGLKVDMDTAAVRYGGYAAVAETSNILFTNGDLDPWAAWGVDCNVHACGTDVTSRLIHGGAHHLDLMFSTEDDPESVKDVREKAREAIRRWIGIKGAEQGLSFAIM